MGKLFRFGLSGLAATLISYAVFIGLITAGLHYALAGAASWVAGVCIGFTLNRRFTFRITGNNGRRHQFHLFMLGSILQLVLALAGYAILIGKLDFAPTAAFCTNLIITTAFSFVFMNLITFRTHGRL